MIVNVQIINLKCKSNLPLKFIFWSSCKCFENYSIKKSLINEINDGLMNLNTITLASI